MLKKYKIKFENGNTLKTNVLDYWDAKKIIWIKKRKGLFRWAHVPVVRK